MDQSNVVVDSEILYPILFLPKKCTSLETNCEMSDNIYIDLNITSPDTDGNETRIYSGFCIVKLVESYNVNSNHTETPNKELSGSPLNCYDIDELPVILAEASPLTFSPYKQSQVWIDPSRSPYVYNHYDSASRENYTFRESRGCIAVQQNNTYITQNVYNYNEQPVPTHRALNNDYGHQKFQKELNNINQQDSGMNLHESYEVGCSESLNQQDSGTNLYEYEDVDCEEFPSLEEEELPLAIMSRTQSQVQEKPKNADQKGDSNALSQLMSTGIQSSSKQRKTILFLGDDTHSGQTIQNISYTDPMITCAGLEVDNEVVVENSSPPRKQKKKKYQCDKCKQIFHQISAFRQHMVGNHTVHNSQPEERDVSYMCSKCGKKLKNQLKFDIHCQGHGNPDLECPTCHKVYASKATLRNHIKIHYRKFPCSYCVRSYETSECLKTHLQKVHYMFMCQYAGCSYVTDKATDLKEHHNVHNKEPSETDFESFLENMSEKEIMIDGYDLKNDVFEEFEEEIDDSGDRIRQADSVIAKIIANNIFQLNNKKAKKYGRYHKACEVCYKTFDRIGDLKRHLIEHIIRSTLAKSPVTAAGTLSIVCEICQMETFSKVDKYKAHLREHAKLTLYQCTFCDKSFSDSSNFSKHKKIHGASYFQCDLCQRKFNSKKMIALHMEYHNKNKPVKCRRCTKVFHFQSMLNKHMKSVHNKQASKRFMCRFCEEYFRTLKDKWDHEWEVHNVRKIIADCVVCSAKFRKYSELKRHCIDEHALNIPSAKKCLKRREVEL